MTNNVNEKVKFKYYIFTRCVNIKFFMLIDSTNVISFTFLMQGKKKMLCSQINRKKSNICI